MCSRERRALPVSAMLLLAWSWLPQAADAQTVRPGARSKPPVVRKVTPAIRGIGQTWVKTGFFNEIDQTQRTAATINEPAIVRFLWGTSLKTANEGFWRLRRKTGPSQFSLVGTGVATNGTGGYFNIDLGPYLPTAAPPVEPAIYHLDVIARTKSKTDMTTATSPGGGGTKIAAQELGTWSAPVVITYAVNTTPPTSFDIDEVYRKVTLVLDRIVLVADQDGPGQEEYLLGGFVQELQRACSGSNGQSCPFSTPLAHHRFGPYRRNLNPPGEAPLGWTFDMGHNPPLKRVKHTFDFALGSGANPVSGQRRFVVTLSLIEEDAGSSIADWSAAVVDLSDLARHGDAFGFSKEDVSEYLTEHAADAIRYVADGLQVLSTVAELGAAVPVVGTGIAVAAFVVVAILEDMQDDYYGTGAAHLTLESNRAADIHQLAGATVGTGATRRYVLKPQTLQFKGPPASNAASAFDGVVDVEFHWEFSEPAQE